MAYRMGSGGGNGDSYASKKPGSVRGAVFAKTKSISYSSTNSDRLYSIGDATSATAESGAIPSKISVQNTGPVPCTIMVGYKAYENDTTIGDSGATRYIHYMLMPGQLFEPPVRAVIVVDTDATVAQLDGTVVENTAPDSNEYTDSGANVDTNDLNNTTTPITIGLDSAASVNFFRVNDIIRVSDDVMRVLGTYSDDPTNSSLAAPQIRVERGLYGSAPEAIAGTPDIRFPFFNNYHDFDKYSVAQTDDSGRFKATNFFGLGRSATVGGGGIVPGSIAIKFYNAGYQELGLSGVSSGKTTGLVASGSYWFKIAIDGGTAESINFTVDTNNTNWGGRNGVLSKIQTALDAKYNNKDSNTFNQRSNVSIANGDIRFTSGQRLSTSAIALTAGADGASATYNLFSQQNGWWPALANIDGAIAARLPDDVIYDRVTYATSPTNVFVFDNGQGRLSGFGCTGFINYETGAINMSSCPVNAEFVYNVAHSSAFSGKFATATTTKGGSLVEILANTVSTKRNAAINVQVF